MPPNTCSDAKKIRKQKHQNGNHLRSNNDVLYNLELLSIYLTRCGVCPSRNCSIRSIAASRCTSAGAAISAGFRIPWVGETVCRYLVFTE